MKLNCAEWNEVAQRMMCNVTSSKRNEWSYLKDKGSCRDENTCKLQNVWQTQSPIGQNSLCLKPWKDIVKSMCYFGLAQYFACTCWETHIYTKCNYKIGQICEVIFYQDDGNNCCIAIVIELFFEEVTIKKNEQIGLICSYIWYYLFQEIYNSLDNNHHNMGFLMFGEN